jgi:hypothetical protein
MKHICTLLSVVFLMGLISRPITAQELPPDDYIQGILPDGSQIMVTNISNQINPKWHTTLIDMTGKVLYALPADLSMNSAEWSPDGSVIAASRGFLPYESTFYLVDPRTEEMQSVEVEIPFSYIDSWSPDGNWLLLTYEDGYYVWERATGETTMFQTLTTMQTVWSPDSQFLTLFTWDNQKNGAIHLYNLHKKQFSTNFLDLDGIPQAKASGMIAWSPDSRQIATVVNGTDGKSIYLINIHEQTATPIFHTEGQLWTLDWSTDGSALYSLFDNIDLTTATSNPSLPPKGVYRIAVDDGTMTPIVVGDIGRISFAPDQQHFLAWDVYSVDGISVSDRLAMGDTASGTLSSIELAYVMTTMRGVYWSADSRTVVVSLCTSDQNDFDVYRIDPLTRKAVTLTEDGSSDSIAICGSGG